MLAAPMPAFNFREVGSELFVYYRRVFPALAVAADFRVGDSYGVDFVTIMSATETKLL